MKLSFRIKKRKNIVFDYLTDMQKFVSVHPVITKIVENDNSNKNSYLVYETLKFGFIPISFTYSVIVESNFDENLVVISAIVMRFTKIKMTFALKSDVEFPDEFTIIEENIIFKSPLPVKSIMESIFRKQHKQLFNNIQMKK